jgi:hypothetical protein
METDADNAGALDESAEDLESAEDTATGENGEAES